MRAVKATMLVAVMMCLLGASHASACDAIGKFVCSTDPTIGIGGLAVTLTSPYETVGATTCNDAAACEVGTFFTHVAMAADYTLEPGGVGGTCAAPYGPINFGTIEIDDPVLCPGDRPADCSPGYYKSPKGKLTWDTECVAFYGSLGTYSDVLWMLSAELGATADQRADAKTALDACFGTASLSPCSED